MRVRTVNINDIFHPNVTQSERDYLIAHRLSDKVSFLDVTKLACVKYNLICTAVSSKGDHPTKSIGVILSANGPNGYHLPVMYLVPTYGRGSRSSSVCAIYVNKYGSMGTSTGTDLKSSNTNYLIKHMDDRGYSRCAYTMAERLAGFINNTISHGSGSVRNEFFSMSVDRSHWGNILRAICGDASIEKIDPSTLRMMHKDYVDLLANESKVKENNSKLFEFFAGDKWVITFNPLNGYNVFSLNLDGIHPLVTHKAETLTSKISWHGLVRNLYDLPEDVYSNIKASYAMYSTYFNSIPNVTGERKIPSELPCLKFNRINRVEDIDTIYERHNKSLGINIPSMYYGMTLVDTRPTYAIDLDGEFMSYHHSSSGEDDQILLINML